MAQLTVLVYSDNALVRAAIRRAISPTPAADLAPLALREFATAAALKEYLDGKGAAALLIVDGEATPEGGLGLARELKDEVYNAPPTIAIIGREADRWLATWARVDGILLHPINPRALAEVVAEQLRKSAAPLNATKNTVDVATSASPSQSH